MRFNADHTDDFAGTGLTMAGLLLLAVMAGPAFLADEPRPPIVSVQDGSTLVTGPKGTALYTYDGVDRGDSCTLSPCRDTWPMLLAAPTDKAVGEWSIYSAEGGSRRVWLYKGKPVFTYVGDTDAKAAKGDGVGADWHALQYVGPRPRVTVPPAAKVSKVASSFILTDYRGYALYTFARDGRTPACKGECLEMWQPLLAPMLAKMTGQWTAVQRPDSIRQWAYRGRLVYTFSQDTAPLQINGDKLGGVWRIIPVSARDADVWTGTAQRTGG